MNTETTTKITISSPGRINLIGEHIDYSGGHVLPASIDKKITLDFESNDKDEIEIHSLDYDLVLKINTGSYKKSSVEWENYVLGVLYYIDRLRPQNITGFKCSITSALPAGSGLSSSAALACGTATGINELFNLGLTDLEIMDVARNAEHHFVGTKCGIMDQFAVVKGQTDQLILLDCRDNSYEYIPAAFDPYKIVLLNTNISHNLAGSEYNQRREECEKALAIVNGHDTDYKYLCDVPLDTLQLRMNQMGESTYTKARYVIEENQRTLDAARVLKKGSLKTFGQLMYESHEGLSKEYEVSCAELDFLVNFTKDKEQVLGSRMMGGGFGGCTINLVHKDYVDTLIDEASTAYKKEFGIDLTPITTVLHDGVKVI
jgi:galactokinase